MIKSNLKFTKYFFILFFIGIVVISCKKDRKTIIEKEWQVESMQVHSDSALVNATADYILSFENKSNYLITLDVNNCSGKVSFGSKDQVDFELPACTKICCDSEYAERLVKVLADINKYELNESSLVLNGDAGERINLKRK